MAAAEEGEALAAAAADVPDRPAGEGSGGKQADGTGLVGWGQAHHGVGCEACQAEHTMLQ